MSENLQKKTPNEGEAAITAKYSDEERMQA